MLSLELARTLEADRQRVRDARERAAGRMTSGRRHPGTPEHALTDEPEAGRLPRMLASRPAAG